ncbi:MAG: NifU family protein [Pseudomonadota bacterium]|nr:NifU family protein [Pseudomonadota bacterium]MEC8467742.1 NifU family protein [Pseudomonadota bacterium]|tara:strand:- start:17322 stop:17897 length:576 start_codon:yes stop_codon:yes gene_type:complete
MDETVMTIRTERTPNPNSLKYNLGRVLIPGGSANFPTVETARKRSPLAERLFEVTGVSAVFLGSDFITITKEDAADWNDVNGGLAPVLEAFFESGEPALTGNKPVDVQEIGADTNDPELVAKIKKLIDEKVRPAVAQDGGDIEYRGFKDGVVYLEMKGACSGCPSSAVTLKQGVEGMLMHYVPEVTSVEAL